MCFLIDIHTNFTYTTTISIYYGQFPALSYIALSWPNKLILQRLKTKISTKWRSNPQYLQKWDAGVGQTKTLSRDGQKSCFRNFDSHFEVIFSKKSYIHRSLVHYSARDQLRNFDQFEVIFLRNTMSGCRTASLVLKFSWFSGNF